MSIIYPLGWPLRQKFLANLRAFTPQETLNHALKPAAVALTIIDHAGEAAIITTRRTTKLASHGGQWALPGGRVDPGESATDAALRELSEEVSLLLSPSDVLGRLDDYITRSGYVVTPLVIWSKARLKDLMANPDEVASIHAFSFNELLREDSPNVESIPESNRQVLSMNYLHNRIYAPTAAIIYQFREVCIYGRHTRVAHFDAPVFAWK